MSRSTPPAFIKALPEATRNLIKKQCAGDWRRVTIDARGAIIVHNNPVAATAKAPRKTPSKAATPRPKARPTAPAPEPERAPEPTPEAAQPVHEPEPQPEPQSEPQVEPEPEDETSSLHPAEALRRGLLPSWDRREFARIETHRPPAWSPEARAAKRPKPDPKMFRRIELEPVLPPSRGPVEEHRADPPKTPPVGDANATRREIARARTPAPTPPPAAMTPPNLVPGVEDAKDWADVDVEESAHELCRKLLSGVPAGVKLPFHNDVEDLEGIDLTMVKSVCRMPQRVEIDTSTAEKGYPVIRFARGDVVVVVGFRNPRIPKIIYARIAGLNLHDWHRKEVQGGGGGSRKREGLPHRPALVVESLRGLGAELTETDNGRSHTVTYKGQDLGKVRTERRMPKLECQNEFQRFQRRIHAINLRAAKAG